MLFRNLMAMDVEEAIRSYPFDAVVLIGGCDKTQPAQLMGAASADVPAIMLTGGTVEAALFRGRELSVGTDLWRYTDELRAGRITLDDYDELEAAWIPGAGHCNEMGTASTMASVTEALGMALPGTATIAALSARRSAAAEAVGRRAVEIAVEDLRPSAILTPAAFDNAITMLAAIGGSTNAVVHLLALARPHRLRARRSSGSTRSPSGRRCSPTCGRPAPTWSSSSTRRRRARGPPRARRADRSGRARPSPAPDRRGGARRGHRAGRRGRSPIRSSRPAAWPSCAGSLAPRGAVLKVASADPSLLRHRGPAVVFEGVDDVAARIDDATLAIDPRRCSVLRDVGPKGAPGMPEWGMVPIPERLLAAGVRDMVRVSDARMWGTAFGTCVLHVAPESYAGGPLAAVSDGDLIALDVEHRTLELEVDPAEVARRLAERPAPAPRYTRGYGRLHVDHVLQADEGCDLDFLTGPPEEGRQVPYGLFGGWVGGWSFGQVPNDRRFPSFSSLTRFRRKLPTQTGVGPARTRRRSAAPRTGPLERLTDTCRRTMAMRRPNHRAGSSTTPARPRFPPAGGGSATAPASLCGSSYGSRTVAFPDITRCAGRPGPMRPASCPTRIEADAVAAADELSENPRSRITTGDAPVHADGARPVVRGASRGLGGRHRRPVAAGVSRPIPAGAAPTARSGAALAAADAQPGFPDTSGAQVRVRPDRRLEAIGGTVRETPATGNWSARRSGFPSRLGNHFAAGHWPGRRRAASTAESLRAPNEDRRRAGLAGRSATFRPPLGRARTAQQAASRRDTRPAIHPAC